MTLNVAVPIILLLSYILTATQSAGQRPILPGLGHPNITAIQGERIAIVGAGIEGASAAFNIH